VFSKTVTENGVAWDKRWFQIINRGKCSTISASDDWYYFCIKRWYWYSVNLLRVHFLLIYTFFLWSLNVIMAKTFPKWSILKSEIITLIISGVISAQRLKLTNGVSNITTEICLHPSCVKTREVV